MSEIIVKVVVSGVTRYHALVKSVGNNVLVIKDFLEKAGPSSPKAISNSPSLDKRESVAESLTTNSAKIKSLNGRIEALGIRMNNAEEKKEK